nr:chemotaxis protein CheA [Candidatus Krumholzibacteria bacterium]
LDHVKDLAHKAENLLDMARRGELELRGEYMDAVFESVDMMKRLITDVGRAMGGDGILGKEADLPELMSKLVAMTSGEPAPAPAPEPIPEPVAAEPEPEPFAVPEDEDGKPKISGFVPLGNMPRKKAASPAPAAPVAAKVETPVPLAPVAKRDCPEEPKKVAQAPVKVKEAVRVDSERLDRLIETIGELVIAESMVTQSPEIKGTNMSVKLSKDIDHLDKICRELQEIGMSLRMVPVRPVFQKMARLVRDLSKKTGRKVDFVMNGEDTELDKNVVDKIGDPLVHMVRNSVDHGIEPDSADRVAAGKSERGRVELRAFHKGGNICIEIEDDGRGLDKAAILQKAVSRGLVREGENLSDRDIFNMIFEAGFSTAKQVTEVSGRGVGMDVVRRNIEELRGTVDISSEVGKGSVFSIKLPLTLAIIEGMVIVVGQEHYIIPTLSVVRLIRPRPEDITHVFDKGEMLAFEGEHLPLFRLSGLFDVTEAVSSPHEATVVVVEDEGKKIGLMADDLLGQQSIVIKSLGESVQGTDGVAGGAIMSDGNVALILDVAGIVRVAHQVDTTGHVLRSQGLVTATVDRDLGQVAEAIVAPAETSSDVAEENVEAGESVQVTS